jgi:hypothetical protein
LTPNSGGLERLPRPLGGHARGGKLPQFAVDERQQVGGGPAVPGGGRVEEMGNGGPVVRVHRPVPDRNCEPGASRVSRSEWDLFRFLVAGVQPVGFTGHGGRGERDRGGRCDEHGDRGPLLRRQRGELGEHSKQVVGGRARDGRRGRSEGFVGGLRVVGGKRCDLHRI